MKLGSCRCNGKATTAESVVTVLEASADAVLTTAESSRGEGATIETKASSLGTEIARLGANTRSKITKAKSEGDLSRKNTQHCECYEVTMNFITRLNF
jgi:hypothetical protein